VLPEGHTVAMTCFCSPQPDTNLCCKTMDMGLVHRVVYVFQPQLYTGTNLYCLVIEAIKPYSLTHLVTEAHGCEQRCYH